MFYTLYIFLVTSRCCPDLPVPVSWDCPLVQFLWLPPRLSALHPFFPSGSRQSQQWVSLFLCALSPGSAEQVGSQFSLPFWHERKPGRLWAYLLTSANLFWVGLRSWNLNLLAKSPRSPQRSWKTRVKNPFKPLSRDPMKPERTDGSVEGLPISRPL